MPIKCSAAFGNPSGHSSASSLIAFVVFMDVFHGKSDHRKIFTKLQYTLGITLALYWAGTIPYTRFLMGVHSLDQIVYGTSLGIWEGLFCHFVVRDNLIDWIEKVKA